MTSEERREARYERRKAARQKRREERGAALGGLAEAFRYGKMFRYGIKCCNGVRWKASTQNFERHLFSGTARRRKKILSGTYKPKPCAHFTIRERGKTRPIDAPHITDRQVDKTLCREVLMPLYAPSTIADNGASQKGKGLHWQFKRLKQQLSRHYRQYGRAGGVLLLDLKGFFPNANRAIIFQRHERYITDPTLRSLADYIVARSPETEPGRGMPLGKEPSQQEMVTLPGKVDNRAKCQMGLRCFGHYMDDYYVILPDLDALKKLERELTDWFESMGVRVNRGKCRIVPLTRPFRWCKARFTLTETGKIRVNGSRDGVKRARRKLRMFHRECLAGRRTVEDAEQYMACQSAYYKNYNDHGRLLRLRRLFYAMFQGGTKPCTES